MSASATRAAERIPRWSSTGYAWARPHRSPALLSTSHSSQKAIVMGARDKPISPTIGCNHPMDAPPRQTAKSIAAVKPP